MLVKFYLQKAVEIIADIKFRRYPLNAGVFTGAPRRLPDNSAPETYDYWNRNFKYPREVWFSYYWVSWVS